MESLDRVPPWGLRPLPANAGTDAKLEGLVDELVSKLHDSIGALDRALNAVCPFCEYDAAANRAAAHVWRVVDQFFNAGSAADKSALLSFAERHMTAHAQARIYRRLVKDTASNVRRKARTLIERGRLREVALPADREGAWDPSGWLHGPGKRIDRHPQGRRIQERNAVPPLANLGQLRKLLGIKSPQQLGWFLLASAAENGPYTTFKIPKRSGGEREIAAPKSQLRWTQRQILDKILAPVPAHPAAHGFVPGRSTVTNAAAWPAVPGIPRLPESGATWLLLAPVSEASLGPLRSPRVRRPPPPAAGGPYRDWDATVPPSAWPASP